MPSAAGRRARPAGRLRGARRCCGGSARDVREVRVAADLEGLDGAGHPRRRVDDDDARRRARGAGASRCARSCGDGLPVLGTCAGLIMLDREHLGLMDMRAERNAFGRQVQELRGRRRASTGFPAARCAASSSARRGSPSTAPACEMLARGRRPSGRRARGPTAGGRVSQRADRRRPRCTSCCSTARVRSRERAGARRCSCGRPAGRRRALQRLPALVELVFGVLGGEAAAHAEQALGAQQVDDDGDVDHERDRLEDGRAIGQLVDLQRQQRASSRGTSDTRPSDVETTGRRPRRPRRCRTRAARRRRGAGATRRS